jgi:heme/copper-type cytochrome/quinol oxidase subunit 3
VEIPGAKTGELEEFEMKRRQKMKNLKTITLLTAIVAVQFVVIAAPAWAQQAHVDLTRYDERKPG